MSHVRRSVRDAAPLWVLLCVGAALGHSKVQP